MIRLACLVALLLTAVNPAWALSVSASARTSTQLVLAYMPPDANPCTVEVSESNTYSPLVPDVNASLFTGANADTRSGTVAAGSLRYFVVGTRTIALASDAKNYSRALQTNTTHYYRVTCGAQVATGSAATMNIPNGFSRGDTLLPDPATPGNILWPTLFSGTDRTASVIDPWTGVLVKRLSLAADTFSGSAGITSGGMHTLCNNNLSAQGFYRCALAAGGGQPRALYAIKPTTGEVRFLGILWFIGQTFGMASGFQTCDTTGGGSWLWDETDPNVYYCQANDAGGKLSLWKVTLGGAAASDTAVTGQTDVTIASVTNLTPAPNDLVPLLTAYAPTFDGTKFNCSLNGIQQQYGMLYCLRGQQDSYGWLFVVNLSNSTIIAGFKPWEHPSSRWCTNHTLIDAGHVPIMLISPQSPKNDGLGTGRYLITLQTTMSSAAAGTTETITVSSTCPGGFPSCVAGDPVSSSDDKWLMGLAVNDLLIFADGSEGVRITAKNSPTSLTVERVYLDLGMTGPAHSIGETLRTSCSAQVINDNHQTTASTEMNWAFLQSPDASNATYYARRTLGGSHSNYRNTMWVADKYQAVIGSLADPATWSGANVYPATFNPTFAGVFAEESPDFYETHPSYHNNFATGLEKDWIVDAHPRSGGIVSTVTSVSGTLYKIVGITDVSVLIRRIFDVAAFKGAKILTDISGPASSILDTSGDNYKFCVALLSNECRSGASAGDVFANVPGLTVLGCGTLFDVNDLCISNKGMRGLSIDQARVQTGLTQDTSISTQRVLTRLFTDPKLWGNTSNAKALPDGSWVFYSSAGELGSVLIKIPPQPTADGKNRTQFMPASIVIPTPPTGTRAQVRFGYAEYGSPTNYYCTSRADACRSVTASLDQANPFKFASETVTGLACTSGCTIQVPTIPQRVTYWQAQYLDSSNAVVATGPVGLAVEGSVITSGPVSVQGTVTIGGKVTIQ